MTAYIRWVSTLSRAAAVAALLLLAAAILVVTQMALLRYFFKASTVWQTEFVIYSLVAMTFLASPYVLLEKGHVNVDLLEMALGRIGRKVVRTLAGLAGLVFCALLAWSGWIYFEEAWSYGWTTETVWKLPLWIPLLPLPLGVGLMTLQYVAELAKIWRDDA
ncbi:TRAP transporter small permease subunit [Roseibium suaedae]|uniref:TRAP transporter small permease protein n=1 Tax=Roseibium suaedae TaxID=735517 RepID=A0A1M7BKD5_9HYPH|nr:TRAP transporter small permease [Roseibium suaedae]SHL55383.1 TRAP-type C4-dicarboxylate transport system, small permease component [Roseibium suaedae]